MNQVAWITGAGKGIGRNLAFVLAKQGWRVAVTSRTMSDLENLKNECEHFAGNIEIYPSDITLDVNIKNLVKKIELEIGPINLAILNAGTYIRFGVEKFCVEEFKKQIDINILGTVNCLAPVMESMLVRRKGHIVVMSSLTAYRGLPFASAYGASKAALTNMCESLKAELEKFNVNISVVHPGFVSTPLTKKNKFPMPFIVDSKFASDKILKGISSGKFEIAFPTRFALIMKGIRCMPYFLYFFIMRRMLGK
jgi:short-subunit dehydrogenase